MHGSFDLDAVKEKLAEMGLDEETINTKMEYMKNNDFGKGFVKGEGCPMRAALE